MCPRGGGYALQAADLGSLAGTLVVEAHTLHTMWEPTIM